MGGSFALIYRADVYNWQLILSEIFNTLKIFRNILKARSLSESYEDYKLLTSSYRIQSINLFYVLNSLL